MSDDELELDVSGSDVMTDTEKLIRALRSENAKRRVANRDLAEREASLAAELDAERQERARLQATLEANKSEIERAAQEKETILEGIRAANETVINSLPDELRAIVPKDFSPVQLRSWLDAAVPVLTKPHYAPVDGVAGSKTDRVTDTLAISQDEAAFAQAMGIDPQQLVKEMARTKT